MIPITLKMTQMTVFKEHEFIEPCGRSMGATRKCGMMPTDFDDDLIVLRQMSTFPEELAMDKGATRTYAHLRGLSSPCVFNNEIRPRR